VVVQFICSFNAHATAAAMAQTTTHKAAYSHSNLFAFPWIFKTEGLEEASSKPNVCLCRRRFIVRSLKLLLV